MGEVVRVFGGGAREGGHGPSAEQYAKFPLNDYGNGLRLIVLAGGSVDKDRRVDATHSRILYLRGQGWIGFNGVFWDVKLGEELTRQLTHEVAIKAPSIWEFAKSDGADWKAFNKWAVGCGSNGSTSAMMRQAQSYLTVEIDDFDRDPFAINCPNGTLKLRWTPGQGGADGAFEAKLCPHDPADRITRVTAARYEPEAKAPLFRKVVVDSFPKADEGEYFKRCNGYGVTGCIHEQAVFWLQGPGQDGKSTILDAIREALGSYGAAANPATFLEGGPQSASGPQPDVVALSGDTRFAVFSEPPRGAKIKEGFLKAWTSGSPVQARDLQSKPFIFRPRAKHFWEMNSLVVTRGDDDGIYRRIHLILFRRKVPKDQVDKLLPNKIREAELSGVLNWLVEGVEDWLRKGGLQRPESLDEVLENYRRASSPFGDWLAERCVWGDDAKGAETPAGFLYENYKEWAEAQGIERPMSQRSFGDALNDRQVLARKNSKGNKVRGPIRLKTAVELAEGYAPASDDPAPAPAASDAPASVGDPSRADPDEEDPFAWGPDAR